MESGKTVVVCGVRIAGTPLEKHIYVDVRSRFDNNWLSK
jgi:hypothetical protein